MRKLITAALLAATALMPAAASAQSRGELRRDRQEIREERRELRDAQRYGDRRDVREERRDVREAREELREDRRDLRQRRQHSRNYVRYVAPHRGFTYRPVNQGYNLQPQFYSQRYYAPGYRAQANARWIRYGDDLLLVNTRRWAADPHEPTWTPANPYVLPSGSPPARIDHVLVGLGRGTVPVRVEHTAVFGAHPVDGVWPSDHAGVVVDLAVGRD